MEENTEHYLDDAVKYITEKSGILLFESKDDLKLAYNRIKTIIKMKSKGDSTEEKKAKKAYECILNNFEEYKLTNENSKLISEIKDFDLNIIYYGNHQKMQEYFNNKIEKEKTKNDGLSWLRKRKIMREYRKKIGLIEQNIKEYQDFYEIDIKRNIFDEIFEYLKIPSHTTADEIANAYNKRIEEIINSDIDVLGMLKEEEILSKYKKIILNTYGETLPLKKENLSYFYSNKAGEREKAFKFFGIEEKYFDAELSEMKKEEMINKIIKKKNEIGINVINTNNSEFANYLKIVEYYENILQKYLKIKTENYKSNNNKMMTAHKKIPVSQKKIVSSKVQQPTTSVSIREEVKQNSEDRIRYILNIFAGLPYEEARQKYNEIVNNLKKNNNENKNDETIKIFEECWKAIEEEMSKKIVYVDNIASVPRKR